MPDCCSSSCETSETSKAPKKYTCPTNGKQYSEVKTETISHHLKRPWEWQTKKQGYYFCSDPNCNTVYFGQDNSVIDKSELRLQVGVKEMKPDSPLCYCYGVTIKDANIDPSIKDFVTEKTKLGECTCSTRNPSGRCCLKDFPE